MQMINEVNQNSKISLPSAFSNCITTASTFKENYLYSGLDDPWLFVLKQCPTVPMFWLTGESSYPWNPKKIPSSQLKSIKNISKKPLRKQSKM
jgi:hypothetical protein